MQTFFKFHSLPYEQIKGSPMASPISGNVTEIVLQKLEKRINSLPQTTIFPQWLPQLIRIKDSAETDSRHYL